MAVGILLYSPVPAWLPVTHLDSIDVEKKTPLFGSHMLVKSQNMFDELCHVSLPTAVNKKE